MIEVLRITPLGTAELCTAKMLPRLIFAFLSVFLSLLIVSWFGVPRDSFPLVIALTTVSLLNATALGVLIASIT